MGIFDDGYQQAIIHAARQPEPLMEISKPSRDSLHLGIAAGRPRTGHLFGDLCRADREISILLVRRERRQRRKAIEPSYKSGTRPTSHDKKAKTSEEIARHDTFSAH